MGVFKIGVNGEFKINYSLLFYYIVSIFIVANLVAYFWSRGQVISAALVGVLLLLVFIFFGLRWFNKPDPNAPKASSCNDPSGNTVDQNPCTDPPNGSSPCPDFMVYYQGPDGKGYCYDINDTYNLKTTTNTSAGMKTMNVNGRSGQAVFDAATLNVQTVATATSASGGIKYLTQEGRHPN